MKAIENFAFGIALGLAAGFSYGIQHPIMTTSVPMTTNTPAPITTAAVEPEKKQCEPQPVFTIPKFLGPYKRGNTGVMHALLSFYELGPGSINDDILANGKTSIGRKPVVGRTIAVDPKVIPYGSHVFIPGFGWRVAEDTGAQIKGNRIDVLVENEEKAYKLGRKSALVLWTR